MNAKHQFKYTYSDTNLEEYSPVEVTFEMPGTATITQMLRNFEQYLRACGYVFDGAFDIVPEGYDIIDEFDGSFYEFEDEPQGGCMADFDKECGCPIGPKGKEGPVGIEQWNEDIKKKASDRADELKEMNERWEKLSNEQKQKCLKEALKMSGDKEVEKNNWVHGICNPPSPDWKATNSQKEYVEDCKPTGKKYSSIKEMVKDLSNMKYNLEVPGVEE